MAEFLIQTINGQIRHDFSFALVEAIDYQNWFRAGSHDYVLSDNVKTGDFSDYIPVGSIQFVRAFLEEYYQKSEMHPINIPVELRGEAFVKRPIHYVTKDEAIYRFEGIGEEYFVKSLSSLKGYTGITKTFRDVPEVDLMVSPVIPIDSEWRCFVYNSKVVGLHNYLGEIFSYPDKEFILEAVKAYKNAPPAYTLDVGVAKDRGTFLIEVHNFYSCGLYGFNDSRILPQMFIQGYRHLLKHKI